jgi:hypothetical protein
MPSNRRVLQRPVRPSIVPGEAQGAVPLECMSACWRVPFPHDAPGQAGGLDGRQTVADRRGFIGNAAPHTHMR